MRYLLDTNVLSEMAKPDRDAGVIAFLNETDEVLICLSVISIAETRDGIERMRASARRDRLALWLEHGVPARFEGRIFRIDADIADVWGRLSAVHYFSQRVMDPMDGFIAATALVNDMTVVTRNVRHFAPLGVKFLNPWAEKCDMD